jgi:hypothetical protein
LLYLKNGILFGKNIFMKKLIYLFLLIPSLCFGQYRMQPDSSSYFYWKSDTFRIQRFWNGFKLTATDSLRIDKLKYLIVADTIKADSIKVGTRWYSQNTVLGNTLDTTKTPLLGHLGTQWDEQVIRDSLTLKMEYRDTTGIAPKIPSGQDLRDTARILRTAINGKQASGTYINRADSSITAPGGYVTNKKLIDSLNYRLAGRLTNRGNWDASGNVFPSSSVLNGDWWTISVKGCIGGTDSLYVGSIITAKMDAPGQTISNWNIISTGGTSTIPVMLKAGSAGTGYLGYKGTTGVAGYLSKRLGTNANDSLSFTGVFNTNNLILGKTSAGGNVTINSNSGVEMVAVPPLTTSVFLRTNWTLGATSWDATNDGDIAINKNGTGVTTATLNTVVPLTADLGTTLFKIVIVCNSYTGSGQLNWTWGGTTGNFPINAAGTFTDYIIPTTTAGLIFTPSTTSFRGKVNSISITRLNQNGALTVNGIANFNNNSLTNATVDEIKLYNNTDADATYSVRVSPSISLKSTSYSSGLSSAYWHIYASSVASGALRTINFDHAFDGLTYANKFSISGATVPIISTPGYYISTYNSTSTGTTIGSFANNATNNTTSNSVGIGLFSVTNASTSVRVRVSPSEVKRGNQWNASGVNENHYYQSFVRGISTTSTSELVDQFSTDGGTTWVDILRRVCTYGVTTPHVNIANYLGVSWEVGANPMFNLDVNGNARIVGSNALYYGGTSTSASDYGSGISFTNPTTSFTNRISGLNWSFAKTGGSYAGVGIFKVPTCPLDVTGLAKIDSINTNSIGVGVSSFPKHRIAAVGGLSTNQYMLNLVFDRNKNRTTYAQAVDSATMNFSFTGGGKPLMNFKNAAGVNVLDLDSLANMVFTNAYRGSSAVADSAFATRKQVSDKIASGIWYYNGTKYAPYTTAQIFMSFDTSANAPTLTGRLNGNFKLWSTNFNSGSSALNGAVLTSTSGSGAFCTSQTGIAGYFSNIGNVTSSASVVSIIKTGSSGNLTGNLLSLTNNATTTGTNTGNMINALDQARTVLALGDRGTTGTINLFDSYRNVSGNTKIIEVKDSGTIKMYVKKDTTFVNNILKVSEDLNYALSHGRMYINAATYTPDVTANVAFRLLPGMTVSKSDNITCAGDTVVATRAGLYSIKASINFNGGNAVDWRFSMFKNFSTAIECEPVITTTGAGNYQQNIGLWEVELAVGDRLCWKITNITNSTDPTIRNMNVLIDKVPDITP